jgi:hypothetical protein
VGTLAVILIVQVAPQHKESRTRGNQGTSRTNELIEKCHAGVVITVYGTNGVFVSNCTVEMTGIPQAAKLSPLRAAVIVPLASMSLRTTLLLLLAESAQVGSITRKEPTLKTDESCRQGGESSSEARAHFEVNNPSCSSASMTSASRVGLALSTGSSTLTSRGSRSPGGSLFVSLVFFSWNSQGTNRRWRTAGSCQTEWRVQGRGYRC